MNLRGPAMLAVTAVIATACAAAAQLQSAPATGAGTGSSIIVLAQPRVPGTAAMRADLGRGHATPVSAVRTASSHAPSAASPAGSASAAGGAQPLQVPDRCSLSVAPGTSRPGPMLPACAVE